MGPNEVLDKGFLAANEVERFRVVKQTDVEECEQNDTEGGDWVGISQESLDEVDVANERHVRVRTMGVSRGIASAAITLRSKVSSTDDGRLKVAAGGDHVVGIAVTPATEEGDWFNVQLTPGVVEPSA